MRFALIDIQPNIIQRPRMSEEMRFALIKIEPHHHSMSIYAEENDDHAMLKGKYKRKK